MLGDLRKQLVQRPPSSPRRVAPCQNDDFQALGSNRTLWDPYRPPGSGQGAMVNQKDFLGAFWPWFKAATLLLKVRHHLKLLVEGRKMCRRPPSFRSAMSILRRAKYDSIGMCSFSVEFVRSASRDRLAYGCVCV